MDIIFVILVATILANLILGWGTFRSQRNSLSAKHFLFIILSIMSWTVAKILFYFGNENVVSAVSIPLLYISGSFIATNFLIFVYIFPNSIFAVSKKLIWAIFAPALVFAALILLDDSIVGDMIVVDETRGVYIGSFYFAYVGFLLIYFISGYAVLMRGLRKATGILRVQFIYVLLGSFIASTGGIITNVFLPWFGNFHLYWLGPPLTIAMVVLFSYAIVKHHLLNVRVIATELFTAVILIVVLLDALLSRSPEEFAAKFGIFIVVMIFGIFLIRGTLREIKELERLSKAKSDFVSIVSHQLRTPLTTIKGFISMIKEGSGTDVERRDWLDKTYTTNERMIRLVNDILNISRIERGNLQYDFKDINLAKLIEEVIEALRIQSEEKGIALNWEKPSIDMPAVRADEEKLRQVITNLIDNAIHYTDKGHINVRLVYLPDLNRIKITVRDTGIGMTAGDLKNLFEQFSRGEGGQKSNVEGMGLGLYVAQSIIKAHNGKIWAESEGLHKGSRFYVELPVQ